MKISLIVCLSIVSSVALSNSALLRTKIERKSLRVSNMISNGKLDQLSRSELKSVLNSLKSAIATIKGTGELPPTPPTPPSRNRVSVDFYLENTLFSFSSRSSSHFYNSCLTRLESSMSGKYDDIHISVNGSAPKHQHNSSSWWTEAEQVCSLVEQEVIKLQNNRPHRGHLSVQGSVEKTPYSFQARSPMEIFKQCVDQFADNIKVDDISVSVNDSRRESFHNSSSWWEGDKVVCSVITSKIK